MKLQTRETKGKLILRLHRIDGQLRGLEKMLEEERDCREIMQQLAAVQSAMQGVSRLFLKDYASLCLQAMAASPDGQMETSHINQEQLIEDMLSLMEKTP